MKRKTSLLIPLAIALSSCTISLPGGLRSSKKTNSGTVHVINNENAPRFDCFDEVIYYAYARDHMVFEFPQEESTDNEEVQGNSESQDFESSEKESPSTENVSTKDSEITSSEEERKTYEDEKGRLHYPIEYSPTYTFSDFTYFRFNADRSNFLDERIKCGEIEGLAAKTNIFDEWILVLKNENNYYSCLTNGGTFGYDVKVLRYSAHKYIEGFDLIKDLDQFISLDLTFEPDQNWQSTDSEPFAPLIPKTIEIDGKAFQVKEEYTVQDPTEKEYSVNELRKYFGLNIDSRFE